MCEKGGEVDKREQGCRCEREGGEDVRENWN